MHNLFNKEDCLTEGERGETMAREFAKDFYNNSRWRRNAKAFAESKHWLCERCRSRCDDRRYIVHHRIHLNEKNIKDDYIAYGWGNLELLCIDCHNREHHSYEEEDRGCKFNSNGDLVGLSPGHVEI